LRSVTLPSSPNTRRMRFASRSSYAMKLGRQPTTASSSACRGDGWEVP
jgi:hypothetical protein